MSTKRICRAKEIDESEEFIYPAHILFVDDDKLFVEIWKHVLEKQGYKVTSFTEALQALEEFKAKPFSFDIVITDQSMPLISGCELGAEILKIRNDIKIILSTGYLSEFDKETALKNKISEFLIKPFYINTLVEAIERNLLL